VQCLTFVHRFSVYFPLKLQLSLGRKNHRDQEGSDENQDCNLRSFARREHFLE